MSLIDSGAEGTGDLFRASSPWHLRAVLGRLAGRFMQRTIRAVSDGVRISTERAVRSS